MTIAQGINKVLAYKKQTGLGTAASGSGGTQLRRVTATFARTKDTYDADEIVSHQQDTGIAYGVSRTNGELNDVLSAGSFAPLFGSLMRNTFAAISALTGLSLTIAGAGPSFTITRGSGDFLAGGIKIGDVVRITAGTYTGVARDLNLLVTGVTATVLTVIVPNGKTLSAQGPIATSTVTVMGKKSVVPSTGQTNDYYTFEEWFSDLTLSRTYVDTQVGSADVSIPATGNSNVKFALLGLSRAKGGSQVLTSPTAASTTAILAAANSKILINAGSTTVATSLSVKIDGQVQSGEAVIGSNTIADNYRGDMKVSGSFTYLKSDEVYSNLFDAETPIGIVGVLFADATDTSDFVSFNIPRVKLVKDELDDGKKQLIGTHDFVAEYNSAGGAALASDTGIITIQDSQA